MNLFLLALSLLTCLPVRLKTPPVQGDTGRAAGWYPLIGIIVGGLVALVFWVTKQAFPPTLAAVLSTGAWIALTGGLHLDGLADCCDGMLHTSSPERRLEIMKDSRLGTFGGIGLLMAITLKITCLTYLTVSKAWIAIPLAAAAARWMLLIAGRQPMARPGGMGYDFALGLQKNVFIQASLFMLAVMVIAGWKGIVAFLAVNMVGWGIIVIARRRLGGLTGDVFGLLVEVNEIIILLIYCAS